MTKGEIEQLQKRCEAYRQELFKVKEELALLKGEEILLNGKIVQSENERLKAERKPNPLNRSLELLDEFIRDNPEGLNEIIAKHVKEMGSDAHFKEEAIEMKSDREWISVEDGLPESPDTYLVIHDGNVRFSRFSYGKFMVMPGHIGEETIEMKNVTHWMHLPNKPPKQ